MRKIGPLERLSAPPPPVGIPPQPYHWMVDSFYRALDAAAFGLWPRVELIRGAVIEHDGQTPRHAATVGNVAEIMRAAAKSGLSVREVNPVQISPDTEPDADVLIVKGGNRDYWERHPGPADIIVLIEVADSSMDYDLGEKAMLYSEAGVTDYWVVLPEREQIVVHRDPTPDGFASVTVLGTDAEVTALAADRPLAVADLLGLRLDETEAH